MSRQGGSQLSDQEVELEIQTLQHDLRGYVISIVGPAGDVEEVIQLTNIFLWDKRSEFQPGTSFKAWAFKVAYFKMMGLRRDAMRRGHVVYTEETIKRISLEAEKKFMGDTGRVKMLRHCITKLKEHEQAMIQEHYIKGKSLVDYAVIIGKSVSAVHKTISRVRLKLRDCINKNTSKS